MLDTHRCWWLKVGGLKPAQVQGCNKYLYTDLSLSPGRQRYNINSPLSTNFSGMNFKFEAKYGLLTYSQSENLDPFDIVLRLSSLGAECIVGREKHQDGGTHYHAFFMFERKYATRNNRIFDVGGHHPNIVRGYGTPEKGWDYATKDGDICAGGLDRPSGVPAGKSDSKWAWIIQAANREEFFERVSSGDPRALCANFSNLQRYAEWKYRPDPIEYESPGGISFTGGKSMECNSWADSNIRLNNDTGGE